MSNGPVTGNGIAIALPAGKIVFWSAVVQAWDDQFVQVKDPDGNVAFTCQGASSSGGTLTQIGEGFFQVPDPVSGNYTIWLGINGGASWSSVLWDQGQLSDSGNTYLGRFIFGSEDGTDNDYNDTLLQMQWFEYIG